MRQAREASPRRRSKLGERDRAAPAACDLHRALPPSGAMERRAPEFGAGVLARAEAETAHQSHLGWEVIGGAATMLIALAYALYESLLAPFVSR